MILMLINTMGPAQGQYQLLVAINATTAGL